MPTQGNTRGQGESLPHVHPSPTKKRDAPLAWGLARTPDLTATRQRAAPSQWPLLEARRLVGWLVGPGRTACRISVPQPRTEPAPPALEVWSQSLECQESLRSTFLLAVSGDELF